MPGHAITSVTAAAALALCAVAGCGKEAAIPSASEAGQLYIQAMKVRIDDEQQCLDLLAKSIEAAPTASAHFHRGWILAKRGALDEAADGVRQGLALEPENADLLWLDGELKKPPQKQSFKMPPSTVK